MATQIIQRFGRNKKKKKWICQNKSLFYTIFDQILISGIARLLSGYYKVDQFNLLLIYNVKFDKNTYNILIQRVKYKQSTIYDLLHLEKKFTKLKKNERCGFVLINHLLFLQLARKSLHVYEKDCKIPVNNYFHLTPEIGSLWGGEVGNLGQWTKYRWFF